MNHCGSLPSFITVTDAWVHEIKVAREKHLPLLPDSIVSVDRGLTNYKWLYCL